MTTKKLIFSRMIPLAIVFIAAVLISSWAFSGLFANAQEGETAAPPIDTSVEVSQCQRLLRSEITELRNEYGAFITKHFRSDIATGALIDIAVERYRQYRRDVLAAYKGLVDVFPQDAGFSAGLLEAPDCAKIVPEELFAAQEVLKAHVSANAQAKQTTRLVDMYKELNSRLDKLYFSTGQIFGYFKTFADKVPCYPTQCVTQ